MRPAFSSLFKGTSWPASCQARISNLHTSCSGFNFGYSAWINSKFLGSNQGTNQYSADGGIDLTNNTWAFDPADLNKGENVLTGVLDPTGMQYIARWWARWAN